MLESGTSPRCSTIYVFLFQFSGLYYVCKREKESIVPTIFNKDGFKFFFYSNEHAPIHVHVRHAGGEAVFEIENEIELRESQNMKIAELKKAQKLALENRDLILEKWNEHLN
jgi:hypothetical protein